MKPLSKEDENSFSNTAGDQEEDTIEGKAISQWGSLIAYINSLSIIHIWRAATLQLMNFLSLADEPRMCLKNYYIKKKTVNMITIAYLKGQA